MFRNNTDNVMFVFREAIFFPCRKLRPDDPYRLMSSSHVFNEIYALLSDGRAALIDIVIFGHH